MSVYVDELRVYPYRYGLPQPRVSTWCHLWSPDLKELDRFARKIGLPPDWLQRDHYDLSRAYRRRALRMGAIAISTREMAMMRTEKRREGVR